jgi:hypothetical protein
MQNSLRRTWVNTWVNWRKGVRGRWRGPVIVAASVIMLLAFLLVQAVHAAGASRGQELAVVRAVALPTINAVLPAALSHAASVAGSVFTSFVLAFTVGMAVIGLTELLWWLSRRAHSD